MEKLVVCIMGQNCEKFIGMCLDAAKDTDAIVYCDGGSIDNTVMKVGEINPNVVYIKNEYNQKDKTMNGKQRNYYLNYLKKNYTDYWMLCLDADEVVEDLSKIKEFIQTAPKDWFYSIKMRHFIGDLGNEDASQVEHFVPHRLFYIDTDLYYDEVEHPILKSKKEMKFLNIRNTNIWHLAYLSGVWDIKKKYENHMKKSNIHPKEFLNNWKKAHLFGQYPKKTINPLEIPEVILNEFGIDKDELYFMGRMQLETKHFLMMKNWMSKFKPKTILDIGCGWGLYGQASKILNNDIEYTGIEKSKWVVRKWPHKDLQVIQCDITKGITLPNSNYDLVLCIDILEHLDYKELDFVLKILPKLGKKIIFSIPFIGDPNLEADLTHKIKEDKKWWIKKLTKYFKIKDVPKDWLFAPQLLIGERK